MFRLPADKILRLEKVAVPEAVVWTVVPERLPEGTRAREMECGPWTFSREVRVLSYTWTAIVNELRLVVG